MSRASILTVCTANICRSPASETLLRSALADLLPNLQVSSAGTQALDGSPACDVTSALIADYLSGPDPSGQRDAEAASHGSRRVSAHDVDRADLILALDRSHRSALAVLSPRSRSRTFTLRQAAASASVVTEVLRAGSLPDGAPPLPQDPQGRFLWWVAELDAMRSYVRPTEIGGRDRVIFDPLDVPDPHVLGYEYHRLSVELIEAGVAVLVDSVVAVLDFGTHAE